MRSKLLRRKKQRGELNLILWYALEKSLMFFMENVNLFRCMLNIRLTFRSKLDIALAGNLPYQLHQRFCMHFLAPLPGVICVSRTHLLAAKSLYINMGHGGMITLKTNLMHQA